MLAVALVVLFSGAPDAPADHGAVFVSNLTVGDLGAGFGIGCDQRLNTTTCDVAMTEDQFTFDGEQYEINYISIASNTFHFSYNVGNIDPDFRNKLSISIKHGDHVTTHKISHTIQGNSVRDFSLGYNRAWQVGDVVTIKLIPNQPTIEGVNIGGVTQDDGIYKLEFSRESLVKAVEVTLTKPITSNVTWVPEITHHNWKYGQQDHRWNTQAISEMFSVTVTPSDWNNPRDFLLLASADNDALDEKAILVLKPRHNATENGNIGAVAIYITVNDNTVGGSSATVDPPQAIQIPTFCDGKTVSKLIASGDYNVIDNRDGSLGSKIKGINGNDLILASWHSYDSNSIKAKAGADCIIGGNGPGVIQAGKGNDAIYSLAGDDLIYGGKGNDAIFCGVGNDVVDGGKGKKDTASPDCEITTKIP